MARGINKVILIGNLGNDPELKYTPSGTAVANVNLATNESWNDKDNNRQERTEWHRLVFWAKLAEIVEKYLKKGSKVYCEGRLQTRQWENKDGVKMYSTEIVVTDMQMLDGRGENGGGGGYSGDPGPAAGGNSGGGNSGGNAGGPAGGAADDEDDLPF